MPSPSATEAKRLEDLGIERKPFYTPGEVARIVGISDQSVLDRIHLPVEDPRHLYAIALGPRTYRIPMGALAQFLGIKARITIGRHPRRIDDAVDHRRDDAVNQRRLAASGKKARPR